jgi:putative FmdB family regulatory protein
VPIYEYQCEDCGASIEAFQKMSDDPLTECEECGGPLRKVLHPVAIHFKGSGFYTTDYGKGSGRHTGAKDTGPGDSAESSSGSGESSSPGDGSPGADARPAGESKAKEKQKAT